MQANYEHMGGQKRKIEMHLSSGQVSLLLSLSHSNCPLGELKRTERTSVFISLAQKKAQRNSALHFYLSAGQVHTGQVKPTQTCPTDKITDLGRVETVFFFLPPECRGKDSGV